MSNVRVEKNNYTVEPLYQWDVNQVLTIHGLSLPSTPEVHFSNMAMERSIVRQASMNAAGVITVEVPNSMLQKPYPVVAHICIYEGDTFETQYKVEVPVRARPQPTDYTLEDDDEEVYSFNKLETLFHERLVTGAEASAIAKKAETAQTVATTAQEEAEASASEAKESATTATAAKTAAQSALTGVQNALKNLPAGDTLIINDLTTGGTAAALSAEQGKILGRRPNPNMLDNWYFADPIDQRGGYVVPPGLEYFSTWGGAVSGVTDKYYTAVHAPGGYDDQYQITVNGATMYIPLGNCVRGYVGVGYCIDRWRTNGASIAILSENGVSVSGSGSETAYTDFFQYINEFRELCGKTVCLSVLSADGRLLTLSCAIPTTLPSSETSFGYLTDGAGGGIWLRGSETRIYTQLRAGVGKTVTFVAAKLELGSVQTLAHQDENGNWVLNDPPPDKGVELLKCQRYYQLFASKVARPTALADFRPAMRTTPAVGTIEIGGVTHYYASADL